MYTVTAITKILVNIAPPLALSALAVILKDFAIGVESDQPTAVLDPRISTKFSAGIW